MRVLARLSALGDKISPATLKQIVEAAPDCVRNDVVFALLPLDDPRMISLLDVFQSAGMRPREHRGPRRGGLEYDLTLNREYSAAELDSCEYLELSPRGEGHAIDGGSPTSNSPDVVLYASPTCDIARVGARCSYVVSAKAKNALEDSGLRNLLFRETKMRRSGIPVDERRSEYERKLHPAKRGPWWELRSDRTLPPVAPSVTLVHNDETPFTGDFSRGCWRREGLYSHPELHYRAEDLAAIEPFDLAHTYEMFHAIPREYDRPLVASKRFYKVCQDAGLTTDWLPVWVDA